jgi:proteasome lid subunit RPN8/RPN11
MDTNPPIRISPPGDSQPRQAPLPTDFALRWESPSDREDSHPVVTVFLTQPAYAHIHVHAASDMQNEVGGILVGQRCVDTLTGVPFLVIENVLAARYTRHSSVHLTFTQDSLVHFHEMVEKRCTGKQIVGWYHTHPRMGIFLSHYDTWLHEHFFPESWQVALVVEPHALLAGFFIRQADGQLDPRRYYGFYEMNGCIGRSAVRWQNLSPICRESE